MSAEQGIIVGTDGTEAGNRAVAEAARLAASWETTLHVVCAYRPASPAARERFNRKLPAGVVLDYVDDHEAQARMILEDCRQQVVLGAPARMHAERGELCAALCRVAERERARCLVVARPARGAVLGRLRRSLFREADRAGWTVVMVDGGARRMPRLWRHSRQPGLAAAG